MKSPQEKMLGTNEKRHMHDETHFKILFAVVIDSPNQLGHIPSKTLWPQTPGDQSSLKGISHPQDSMMNLI
jgi:hypothetical protein